MKLGGLSTSSKFIFKKIKEDLNIYLEYFGKIKFIFMYFKKISIKIKQYKILKNKEVHDKNLSVLLKSKL